MVICLFDAMCLLLLNPPSWNQSLEEQVEPKQTPISQNITAIDR